MKKLVSYRRNGIVFGAFLTTLGLAVPAAAQTVSGQALAVQSIVNGPLGTTVTTLADTGMLTGSNDAREASASTGTVPAVATGNTLHATTIGWPDQVKSEASIADLTVTVGGVTVGAGFVMARASAVQGTPAGGTVSIDSLTINGLPIAVSGLPNQTIGIPGGRVVINEQQTSATIAVVNGLHIAVTGIADIVVASAKAALQ
jgi:hypothetical protein